jgi:hypothetical protein
MSDAYSFSSASGICAYCASDSDCAKGHFCWAGKQTLPRSPTSPSAAAAAEPIVPSCTASPCRPEQAQRCWCNSQGPTGSPLAQARNCPPGFYCLVGDVPGSAVAMSLLYSGASLKHNRAPVQQCAKASSQGDVCAMILGRWVAQPGACTGPQGQQGLCENVGLISEDSNTSEQSVCTHACSSDAECLQSLQEHQEQLGSNLASSDDGWSSTRSLGMCDTDRVFHKAGSFCILTSARSQASGKVHVPGVACSPAAGTRCGPVGDSQLPQACVAHPKWAGRRASKANNKLRAAPATEGAAVATAAGPRYGVCAALCTKVGERCRKADAAAVAGPGDLSFMYGPYYPQGADSHTVCVEQQVVGGGGEKVLACLPPAGE